MQITDGAAAPAGKSGTRDGKLSSKKLLAGTDGSPNNYSLDIGSSDTEYAAPRHHHNFEQVRYNVKGEIKYGDILFPAGWVVYFPESAFYGPQVRKLGSLTVTAQFGGSSGAGYISKKEQKIAYDELLKKGEFTKGAFSYVDAEGKRHNQDAFEAVFEQATKQKLVYPPSRYHDIILMNPENFPWIESKDEPGIAYKWLGTFTERETRIGFIRVDPGATLNVGLHVSPELLFLAKGLVHHAGHTYGPHSAFGLEPKEGPIPIEAVEQSEILCIQMPKF